MNIDTLDGKWLDRLGVIATVKGTTVVRELENAITVYCEAVRRVPGFVDDLQAICADPESDLSVLLASWDRQGPPEVGDSDGPG